LAFRNHGWDGVYEVLTFQEVIDLAKRKSREKGRTIGIYPETKHPTYFKSIGLPLESRLVEMLNRNGYTHPNSPVFIQSFELANLRELRKMTKVPLIFLLVEAKWQPYDFVVAGDTRAYGDLTKPEALAEIATFANGIGPYKRLIVPEGPDHRLLPPTSLVADAHRAGLRVHPYTFRDEPTFLAADYKLDPIAEYLQFYELGVDGLFRLCRALPRSRRRAR
jgi:glycerophosphoryl diester phosphodiesterase